MVEMCYEAKQFVQLNPASSSAQIAKAMSSKVEDAQLESTFGLSTKDIPANEPTKLDTARCRSTSSMRC